MSRLTAVVVCPGRGVYGREELGYLARLHAEKQALLDQVDAPRRARGAPGVAHLDSLASYAAATHASSTNASSLIYAAAMGDLVDIDQERVEIVAICGNSLGWYLSLAASGALSFGDGAVLVDAMGDLMERQGVGGQIVYPLCDAQWRRDPVRVAAVSAALDAANAVGRAYISIRLGGMAVLAGDEAGLAALEASLEPVDGRYPMRLARHAAFHTPLLRTIAAEASAKLSPDLFAPPLVPLIDGRGHVWSPWTSSPEALHAYTLGAQITQTYDFTASILSAVCEFAPDRLIVLGPGSTLAPPVAQALIDHGWRGLSSKDDFARVQAVDPLVIAMGRPDQRALVVRPSGRPAAG